MAYSSYFSGTPSKLLFDFASSTSAVTTTSGTFTNLSGITLTPQIAGTYLVIFSGDMYATGSGVSSGETRIVVDNSAVSETISSVKQEVTLLLGQIRTAAVGIGSGCIVGIVTVDGTQPINVQYRRTSSGGTIGCRNRSLIAIKVG